MRSDMGPNATLARERASPLPPVAWTPVLLTTGAMMVLLLAYAGRYGYHRDELYFLSCAKRMAWGFVDQPPVTPGIAWLSERVALGSLVALRVWPALFSAASIVLAVFCARELGANRLGQEATAIVLAAAPGMLLAGTPAQHGQPRYHALGDNDAPGAEAAPHRGRTALDPDRAGHRNRTAEQVDDWVPRGRAAARDPRRARAAAARDTVVRGGGRARARAMGAEPLVASSPRLGPAPDAGRDPGTILGPRRDAGVDSAAVRHHRIPGGPALGRWLWRVLTFEEARPFRALGIAYVVLAVALAIAAGDKPYYVAGLYLPLTAAGAVPFERWWARNAHRARRAVVPIVLALLTVMGYPIVLPIQPARTLADVPLQDIDYDLGEQIGWPIFVSQIEDAWATIPVDVRATAIVLTGNYGEAGAIERYGTNLPTPYSGHVTWWWWRTPPEDTTTVLAVGFSESYLARFFNDLEVVGRLDNGLDVDTEEQGHLLIIARGPKQPLPAMWPSLRHYT
jgi:hypothetical protein